MSNPFQRMNDSFKKPNRNTFDGSFVNHLTLKAGEITPCYLSAVMPGDTFKIDAKFGFNFDPMIFPVQSPMKANLHFFYVPNRALWKGWEDFITKQRNRDGDSTPPYIRLNAANREMFTTGKIGDFLGVPTVSYGSAIETNEVKLKTYQTNPTRQRYLNTELYDEMASLVSLSLNANSTTEQFVAVISQITLDTEYIQVGTSTNKSRCIPVFEATLPPNTYRINFSPLSFSFPSFTNMVGGENPKSIRLVMLYDNDELQYIAARLVIDSTVRFFSFLEGVTIDNDNVVEISRNSPFFGHNFSLVVIPLYYYEGTSYPSVTTTSNRGVVFDASLGIQNSQLELSQLPFASSADDGPDKLRISAMPFRAVQAVYNSFYRDERNNPLIIDGEPYYNIWAENRNGGADDGVYQLYKANWQQDMFTTAVQSPQQGVAPLVGVTATGQMTFSDENGKTYYLQAQLDDDGTLTGIQSYSSDMPVGTLRAMVDTISTGISINDFRNTNALQRWLETNMRRGYRYKDVIESHFGVSPTYSELLMPQFIGGMSRDIRMSAVEQTVDTVPQGGYPLGTLAGRASAFGEGGHPVSHFCEEHGWIIGFISITPTPVYSQQLNKELLKENLLDYYFPEFAHIGFQPILNREIAPLQCKAGQQENGDGLNDVFGYNRAWYEYLGRVDEVHGGFRDTRRNFLIQRVFDGVPQLSPDFLTVRDKEVNEVFAVQDKNQSDHIFGMISFDVRMKRPLPSVGIPRLEVD